MVTTYPNPCCRCGFCCLSETCPTGQTGFGVGEHDPCPGLSFDGEVAVCDLAANAPNQAWAEFFIGVGDGCCIKARALAKGVTYDFAMLPPHIKRGLAQGAR